MIYGSAKWSLYDIVIRSSQKSMVELKPSLLPYPRGLLKIERYYLNIMSFY